MNCEGPAQLRRTLCDGTPAETKRPMKRLPLRDAAAEESLKEQPSVPKRKRSSGGPDEIFRKKAKPRSIEEIAQCRKQIVQILETRLHSGRASNVARVKDMTAFARATERTLFATASSVEEHCNIKSLDDRLFTLFAALMNRRHRKLEREQNRQLFLRNLIGKEKLNELLATANEIRTLRFSLVSAGCNSSARANGTCHTSHFPKTMPDVVKNIFFRNRLVLALDQEPMDRLSTLDWEDLLLEAKSHIQEYLAWSQHPREQETSSQASMDQSR